LWTTTTESIPRPALFSSSEIWAHRPPRGQRPPRPDPHPDPHPEEKAIVAAVPELADYVVGVKQRSRKVITLALRQLLRLVREYPREPLLEQCARPVVTVFTIWTGWNA
jgi:hypothetical protein